jgi:hypothetical protein
MLRQARQLHAGSMEVNESRYWNVHHQVDFSLRPYETEYLDHPILPYPIETIHVI